MKIQTPLSLALLSAAVVAAADPTYKAQLIPLPTIGGYKNSVAFGINDAGVVTGSLHTSPGASAAHNGDGFIWNGASQAIIGGAGSHTGIGVAINNAGTVLAADDGPTLYRAGGSGAAGDPVAFFAQYAPSIAKDGTIAYADVSGGGSSGPAFSVKPNGDTVMLGATGSQSGNGFATVDAIASNGDIAGRDDYDNANGAAVTRNSWLYHNGDFTTEFTRPGGTDDSQVLALNNGLAVGYVDDDGSMGTARRVAVWDYSAYGATATATLLTGEGELLPTAINASGDFVATNGATKYDILNDAPTNYDNGAFVFLKSNSGYSEYDLNSLIANRSDLPAGFSLWGAFDINASGQIVGYGRASDGINRAIVLTPQAVPEPATCAALGLGIVALIRRRRR